MLIEIFEAILEFIIRLFKGKQKNATNTPKRNYWYTKKNIMTGTEQKFYNMLKHIVGEDYIVWPQINLAAVIKKNGQTRYQNELYRNVDFGIFLKDSHEILLLIELNDESHNLASRKKRDKSVKSICEEAGINIISFWLNKPNEYNYVRNRIMQFLNTTKDDALNVEGVSRIGEEIITK
jgi:hypothetical protein